MDLEIRDMHNTKLIILHDSRYAELALEELLSEAGERRQLDDVDYLELNNCYCARYAVRSSGSGVSTGVPIGLM
jgi:hypothetical protein